MIKSKIILFGMVTLVSSSIFANKIDITGIDKFTLIRALHENATPETMVDQSTTFDPREYDSKNGGPGTAQKIVDTLRSDS